MTVGGASAILTSSWRGTICTYHAYNKDKDEHTAINKHVHYKKRLRRSGNIIVHEDLLFYSKMCS